MKRTGIVNASPFLVFLFLIVFILATAPPVQAAQQTLTKTVAGPAWLLDDNPPPKTYWAPWYPMPTQALLRYGMGFRISTGAVAVRCPVKVTVRYDDAQAKGGETLVLHVKAEPVASLGGNDNQRTFDAGFGIGLPTKVQLGFVGVTGLPDILPWKDLPLDLWGLIALIPEVGGTIASAASNVGVFMDSTDPCPLGGSAEFHDERDLISVDLKDLITDADTEGKPKDLATRLWDKVPGSVKTVVKNGIKVADMVNDETAQNRAIDLMADGLNLVTSAGELTLSADPYWRVQGERLVVLVRYRIPGKMLSGNVPLTFTAPDQEQDIAIPLPAFVNTANNVEILIDQVEYDFKLYQSMSAQITFSSMLDCNLGDAEKLVRSPQSIGKFTSDNDLHVPLAPPDEAIVNFRAKGGFEALIVYFSSPAMAVKATVDVYKGGAKVKTVTESSPRLAHAIIVPGLEEDVPYTIRMNYVDSAGNAYVHGQVASCRTKTGDAVDYLQTNLGSGGVTMTTPNVYPEETRASFNWGTTRNGTTFVYLSPLDDFNLYTSAILHQGGKVSVGDCTSEEGNPEMGINHNITVPDLEPGTTYQYVARTWFYDNDDPTDNPDYALAYRGTFTTTAPPPPPQATLQVKLGGQAQAGVPVKITRLNMSPVEVVNLVTGTDGKTPAFAMTPGAQYRADVTEQACSRASLTLWQAPGAASSSPGNVVLDLHAKSHPGGTVLDLAGNPIGGASVGLSGKFQAVQTNGQGRFLPQGAIPSPGTYNLNVTKSGYLDGTMRAVVDSCGLVSADACVLTPATVNLTVRVLRPNGQPLGGTHIDICPPNQTTNCQDGGSTNSNGVATPTFTFTADQAVERLIVATPQGNVGSAFLPDQASLTFAPTENPTVEIYCAAKPPPEVTAFSAGQKGDRIQVKVSLGSQGRIGLEYVTPSGQTQTLQPPQAPAASRDMEITGCQSGTYRIRAMIYDNWGRESATGMLEVRYWSAADWNLQASNLGVTSARLSWNKYDGSGVFKGYVLTVNGGGAQTVASQGSLERVLGDLTPNQPATVALYAKNASGEPISETAQVTFTTTNQAPVISALTLSPDVVGLGQQVELSGAAADPDGKLARIQVLSPTGEAVYDKKAGGASASIKAKFLPQGNGDLVYTVRAEDEFGAVAEAPASLRVLRIAMPEIKLAEAPKEAEILTEWTAVFRILNPDQMPEELTLNAAWDKQAPEQISLRPGDVTAQGDFQVTRSFETAGKHQLVLSLTARAEELSFTSKEAKVQVKAVENPPQLALTCSGSGPHKTFHVTVRPGSLDIARWTLDFGDKSLAPPVAGPADTDVVHDYLATAGQQPLKNATATLTATDVRGKEYKATVRVTDLTPPAVQSTRDDLIGSQDQSSADLSISAKLPSKAVAGQETVVTATVKNGSKQDLTRIPVVLTLDGKEMAATKVDVQAGKTAQVELAFTPEVPGSQALAVTVLLPEGVSDPKTNNNSVQKTLKVAEPLGSKE